MMPDNIPQETWKKADEFLDALANGTTDAQQLAAKDAEIAKLQEIVRTQAEEAAKATYYYTDKMDELKKECDALAGALRAHEQHMGEAQHTCVRYLVPAADPIRIEKEQFVSEMLGHFDGPEQRAVQEKANAALAQYAAI
jgi:hypothetical protein